MDRLGRTGCALVLLLATIGAGVQGAPIYIGDAATQGSGLTAAGGPRADTVNVLTYVFTDPSNV